MFVGVIVDNFHKCRQEQAEEEKRLKAERRARKALNNGRLGGCLYCVSFFLTSYDSPNNNKLRHVFLLSI